MISIIIASVNSELLKKVSENVKDTIGVEFEILSFPNAGGTKGLCEIYNEGASNAKFELLCFMHEDIALLTENWGKKVASIFQDDAEIGILGIVGSKYKALSPSGWHVRSLPAERGNIIQQFKFEDKPEHHHFINPDKKKLEEVAVVDGVWFCTTRSVWSKFKFDELNLKKFHGYDIDFSLQVGQQYKVMVSFEILLKHFSEGNFDAQWIYETLIVYEKWKSFLPINKGDFSSKETRKGERKTFKMFVKKLTSNKLNVFPLFSILWSSRLIKNLGIINFIRLNFFLAVKAIF